MGKNLMRLKRHRQDVKMLMNQWASFGASPVLINIAERYQRLILAMEETLTCMDTNYYTERRYKVIKDEEEKASGTTKKKSVN
jgi:hypothetical protein